jgi:hypothetical protein
VILLGSCIALLLILPCKGWITITTPQASVRSSPVVGTGIGIGIVMDTDSMRLDASSSLLPEDDSAADTDIDNALTLKPRIYRAAFAGVAVSPTGFWVMLRVGTDQYWPVQVTVTKSTTSTTTATAGDTGDPDRPAVTSPEALTLLQLLAGVDMAGAILPPELLSRILIGVCDDDHDNDDYHGTDDQTDKDKDNAKRIVRDLVRRSSNWPDQAPVNTAYLELPDWWQNSIRLPVCTLDEIQYIYRDTSTSITSTGCGGTWEYQCQVQDVGPQTVIPTCHVLQKVAWSDPATVTAATADDDETEHVPCGEQAAFFALALALRYQAPIRLSLSAAVSDSLFLSHDQVIEQFPLYRSRDKLQETSATVTKNIERGFEIHKLQRALQIAIAKQDVTAAAKIRVRLDEMDSLQDLPVQPETDTRNMQ